MALTRYTFDSVRSCIWISGRSSLHPINTETRGITGWFETAARSDGSLDLTLPVSGELELAVERLTSGNQLYDRELRRRIDARRFPTIAGRLTGIVLDGAHPNYEVTGEVSFHGKTRTFGHGMQIEVDEESIALTGEDVFDIREFRHEAAEHAHGSRLPRDHRPGGAARRTRRARLTPRRTQRGQFAAVGAGYSRLIWSDGASGTTAHPARSGPRTGGERCSMPTGTALESRHRDPSKGADHGEP